MASFLFVTTSNLTTNPRLVKEAIHASNNGNHVEILCFKYKGWSEQLDLFWIDKHKQIKVQKISTLSVENRLWPLAGILEKFSRYWYILFTKSIKLNAFASTKRSILLTRALSCAKSYHLIIAHNIGALYPAWLVHQKTGIPFIFDVEDYHPGEYIDSDAIHEKKRREFLLQKLLPDAASITVASPLIGTQITTMMGKTPIKNMMVINNCFSSDDFKYREPNIEYSNQKINFVWFSQNIAANRGLELIIPLLAKKKEQVQLHLIGNLYDDFSQRWVEPNKNFITVYKPMPQAELNRFICNFDIGLALELPSADENRQICLTNKIWAYLQAGLFILASNTPAQADFMREQKGHGLIFEITTKQQNSNEKYDSASNAITMILKNIETIRKSKKERFEGVKQHSWEKESIKLKSMWDKIITNQ